MRMGRYGQWFVTEMALTVRWDNGHTQHNTHTQIRHYKITLFTQMHKTSAYDR